MQSRAGLAAILAISRFGPAWAWQAPKAAERSKLTEGERADLTAVSRTSFGRWSSTCLVLDGSSRQPEFHSPSS